MAREKRGRRCTSGFASRVWAEAAVPEMVASGAERPRLLSDIFVLHSQLLCLRRVGGTKQWRAFVYRLICFTFHTFLRFQWITGLVFSQHFYKRDADSSGPLCFDLNVGTLH